MNAYTRHRMSLETHASKLPTTIHMAKTPAAGVCNPCPLLINRRIFRHLKLEIALAIPASIDEK